MVKTCRVQENDDPTDGPEPKRNKPSEMNDSKEKSPTLAHHITAAKPFIISRFNLRDGPKGCERLWHLLAGTEWQEDGEVCARALWCGMPPAKLQGTSIMTNAEALATAMGGTRNLTQAKKFWEHIDETIRQEPVLVFSALNRGIQIDKELKDKKELLKDGLSKYKGDVELALCARNGHG
jgi:hypothetical protein